MTPAPTMPDPRYPGTDAQPWLEIARRCFRRAARLHAEAHRKAGERSSYSCPREEREWEWGAGNFWARVGKRAAWYAGDRPVEVPDYLRKPKNRKSR